MKSVWWLLFFFVENALSDYYHPRIIDVPVRKFDPTWASLDSRQAPAWFDDVKIGIFLHWGVFSVPSFGSEWFWWNWKGANNQEYKNFMSKNYPPNFTYQEFAKDFTAEFFDPDQWAELFKNSGAKYVVLTSKHHEGYAMWPSKFSFGWNVHDVGPQRDVLGDLAQSVRGKGLKFGIYHSLFEWFNPIYLSDKKNLFVTQEFVNNKVLPEMYELVNTYKPSIIWSDGDWETFDVYWKARDFLAWLYNDSPVKDEVLVNDRWGIGIPCKHGDFYSCQDRYNPGVLQPHKWENAMTLDKLSWGYRRNANISDYLTIEELLKTLAQTISCGGNLLINVGPTKEGIIAPVFQERLLELGTWLSVNGEAIYKSKPWKAQNDTLTPGVWFTSDGGHNTYAIVLQWPSNNVLQLQSATPLFATSATKVTLVGNPGILKWTVKSGTVNIQFPDRTIAVSKWAWVLKIST